MSECHFILTFFLYNCFGIKYDIHNSSSLGLNQKINPLNT